MTALMIACGSSRISVEVVDALLQAKGIDPNLQDDFGWTALMLASRRSGAADIVDRLLQENRVDVHLRAKDGSNALIVASRYDEDRAVERLLRVDGIEVNAQDERGYGSDVGGLRRKYTSRRSTTWSQRGPGGHGGRGGEVGA
ncbi:ankyrin repeat domain-containing protein 50 [Coprinopsis cinerea AmutBmut pab1-1]|nr:ankyrin repeat domain-containing protein 50 [Coprinopsis cinerea AmutBmut pab1-1]